MTEVMIWSPIDRILWGIALSLSLICGLMYLIQGKKNEDANEKRISFGYSFVFFIATIGATFLLLSEFQIPGTYINQIFYGNYEETTLTYDFFIKYGWVLSSCQFVLFFYTFERFLKKTKYLITISNLICIILLAIVPFNYGFFLGLVSIYMFIFLIVLLLYTKWSRLEFKAVSAFILLGDILITVSSAFNTPVLKAVNIIPTIIPPIFSIFGFIFCLLPTIVNSKYFTQGSKYWKIIGAVVIGLLSVVVVFGIFYLTDPFYYVMGSILLLFVIFSLYYTLKSIKSEMDLEEKKEPIDVLEAFTRPKKVTEEEVTVSKEKRICVVCKGKLERKMYICPDCNTFYCNKCSDSLAGLENMCWVCNAPFDEFKPVKPFKNEKEEAGVEIETREKSSKKKL
jgi:hypothetical protein